MVDLDKLRKVAVCVFLAAEKEVAEDIAKHIRGAADEIERLREKVEILEAEIRVMRKLPSAIDAALNIHERETP